jgi:hypothetical protein
MKRRSILLAKDGGIMQPIEKINLDVQDAGETPPLFVIHAKISFYSGSTSSVTLS